MAVVPAEDDAAIGPPSEPIVFLTPWQRFGSRRLYVMDEFGAEGGYLDLKSGELSGTTSTSEGVFRQVLPQLGTGAGKIGITTEDWAVVEEFLATDPSTDRYEAQAIIVGCRLENRWMDRLFVRLVAPGSVKVDIGWASLRDDKLHAEDPDAEAVIRYCRRSYLEASGARP